MPVTEDELREEFQALLQDAYELAPEVAGEAQRVLQLGLAEPLGTEEAMRVLTAVIETLRQSERAMTDGPTKVALSGDINSLVDRILAVRERVVSPAPDIQDGNRHGVVLHSRDNVLKGPV